MGPSFESSNTRPFRKARKGPGKGPEEKWNRRERDVLWEERAKAVSIQHGIAVNQSP